MIPNDGSEIIVDDIKQKVIYYLVPKDDGDVLIVDLPEIVHEDIDAWINDGKKDLYLNTIKRKFTFRDALVDKQVIGVNRYGMTSRNLRVSYSTMLFGFHRRSE